MFIRSPSSIGPITLSAWLRAAVITTAVAKRTTIKIDPLPAITHLLAITLGGKQTLQLLTIRTIVRLAV